MARGFLGEVGRRLHPRPREFTDRQGHARLKEDVLAGLPRKDFRVYPATMPSVQAQAYELARRHLADGARGAALKLLHHIRGVSLHPEPPDTVQDDLQAYFSRSARFDSVCRILGCIHARGERALIFTEHRRMQAFVAQWIRSEFGLREVRIINGATTIARRKAYVSALRNSITFGAVRALTVDCEDCGGVRTADAITRGTPQASRSPTLELSRWNSSGHSRRATARRRPALKEDTITDAANMVHATALAPRPRIRSH